MAAPKVHSIQHSEQGTLVTFDLGSKLSPTEALMEINSALGRMGIIALAATAFAGAAASNDNAKTPPAAPKTEAKASTPAKAETKPASTTPPPPPAATSAKPKTEKAKTPPPPPPPAEDEESAESAEGDDEDLSGLDGDEGSDEGGMEIDPAVIAMEKLSEVVGYARKGEGGVKRDKAAIIKWCEERASAIPALAKIPNLRERLERQLALAKIT